MTARKTGSAPSPVPPPPSPFAPFVETLPVGSELYRVHTSNRGPAEFNPGVGGPTRFAFFGSPAVPALYAAETEQAAICESLLHDVPVSGGAIIPRDYAAKVINRLLVRRDLRLAQFHGTGLRRLGIEARQLTDTESAHYASTVAWAEAAHTDDEIDGVVWMSRRCNSDRAVMLFGDRVEPADLSVSTSYGRVFADSTDLGWLSDFCAPLGVDVLI